MGKIFSKQNIMILVVALGTILAVNRIPSVAKIIKPMA